MKIHNLHSLAIAIEKLKDAMAELSEAGCYDKITLTCSMSSDVIAEEIDKLADVLSCEIKKIENENRQQGARNDS
jgi:acetolactate synthase regulatory subunit